MTATMSALTPMHSEKHAPARAVYRHADLHRLMHPGSIAIVGASPKPASFGARTLANLHAYTGDIYLVNANYEQIGERACAPSLSALPTVPDCALIAVPRAGVADIVRESVALGVGGLIIFASGFGESPVAEYQALQHELVALTAGTRTRIMGPNCLGILNALNGMHGTFAPIPLTLHREGARTIGLISQSGALGTGLSQAAETGVSFSHVLMAGNASDVDVADQIAYLADDPGCDVIACIFEGTHAPQRLLEAGRIAATHKKPVVVFKVATGESGAAAAVSHTGALAGSAAAYEALFERAGFITVSDIDALIPTASFFAKAPQPVAPGVAVLTPSGGAGIVAADQADLHGVPLPQPKAELAAVLASHIPEFGAARNPCDVTAQILNDPHSFPACVDAFLSQPDIGAVVVPTVFAHANGRQRALDVGAAAHRHGKIACVYWLSGWPEGVGAKDLEMDPTVALFRSTSQCFAALAAWGLWWQRLALPPQALSAPRTDAQRRVVTEGLSAPGAGALSESQSRRILAAYDIPTVSELRAHSATEAVAHAQRIGFPVGIKVESPALPHKTEAGVIALNLHNSGAVNEAYERVYSNALKTTQPEHIHGVLIQPMIEPGIEILVGARVDPLFGPLIVVGLGGVFVELLQDSIVSLAPVDRRGARQMLGRLRGRALLDGFRGGASVDLDALADVVARVSELIADYRNDIVEIDVNPLICKGSRILAVDALVVRATTHIDQSARSIPA